MNTLGTTANMGTATPNPFKINETAAHILPASGVKSDDENSTASSYMRRQSSGSFTAGSDSVKALTIISEMLETYNSMIEANTNSIKENAALQETNFTAMRSALESVIDAINGISQRSLNLEDTSRKNAEKLSSISDELIERSTPFLHKRLDEYQSRIEANERDIVYLKDCVESSSESVQIIEGRLGNLEGRVSNIERLLMKHKKRNQNDVTAKTA
jgi:predicted  nucleic acid-binding Zn-ribbon protein